MMCRERTHTARTNVERTNTARTYASRAQAPRTDAPRTNVLRNYLSRTCGVQRIAARRATAAALVFCVLTAGTVAAQTASVPVRILGPNATMVRAELVHTLKPDSKLTRGWSSLYATALSDRGEVAAAAIVQPGALLISVYASDGTLRWSRELATSSVPSVKFDGDTLAIVERDAENQNELVLLNAATGATLRRYAVPTLEDELAYVLGRYNGSWYVQVQRSLGEYVARGLPYRTLRRMEESAGSWDDVFTHTDSTPRVLLPDGVSALPTPFAPAPSFALSPTYGPLFVSGTNWDIHAVQRNGTLQPQWRFTPLSGRLADSTYDRIVAEWIANPPARMGMSAGEYQQAAELGRAAVGRTLGGVLTDANGALFVRRRDADSSASAAARPTVWDLVHPDSDVIHRLRLDAGESLLKLSTNRTLLTYRVSGDGVRSLQVMRAVPAEVPR